MFPPGADVIPCAVTPVPPGAKAAALHHLPERHLSCCHMPAHAGVGPAGCGHGRRHHRCAQAAGVLSCSCSHPRGMQQIPRAWHVTVRGRSVVQQRAMQSMHGQRQCLGPDADLVTLTSSPIVRASPAIWQICSILARRLACGTDRLLPVRSQYGYC